MSVALLFLKTANKETKGQSMHAGEMQKHLWALEAVYPRSTAMAGADKRCF